LGDSGPEVGELGEVDCDFEESEGPGVRGGLGNELELEVSIASTPGRAGELDGKSLHGEIGFNGG